jgi:hypothetical protein
MNMKHNTCLLPATGAEVKLLDSGVMWHGGVVRLRKKYYAVSQALAERVRLVAVRDAAEHSVLVGNEFSWCEQISENTTSRAVTWRKSLRVIVDGRHGRSSPKCYRHRKRRAFH